MYYMYFLYYMYYIYIYNMPRNSCIPAFLRVFFFSKGLSQSAPLFGAAFSSARGSWIPSEGDGHARAKGFVGFSVPKPFWRVPKWDDNNHP